jgi:hypothetical protein
MVSFKFLGSLLLWERETLIRGNGPCVESLLELSKIILLRLLLVAVPNMMLA